MSLSQGDIYLQLGVCMKSSEEAAKAGEQSVRDMTKFRGMLAQALSMPEFAPVHAGFQQLFDMINMALIEREGINARFEETMRRINGQ